jgi:hypothetical protein
MLRMLLRTYLDMHQMPVARFAATIQVGEAAVYRYLSGRVPEPEVLERIAQATAGAVLPNDFHQFAHRYASGPCEQRA